MPEQNPPKEPKILILTPSDPRYAEVKRRMDAGEIKLESLADSAQDLTRSIHKRDRRLVGYYASWTRRTRGFLPEQVRGDLLTHLNYAFAVIDPSTLTARSADADLDAENFASLLALKQKYPHLKVLLSIGGWTDSGYFSDMALSAASRQRFIQSCCQNFLDAYPGVFDGFDLDWEYPVSNGLPENHRRPEDKANFTALMYEFRQVLDARSSTETQHTGQEVYYFLTAALPAGLHQLQDSFELTGSELYARLDQPDDL